MSYSRLVLVLRWLNVLRYRYEKLFTAFKCWVKKHILVLPRPYSLPLLYIMAASFSF